MIQGSNVTLEDIRAAAEYLSGKINKTPIDHSDTFSELFNCNMYFKLENLQKTGSFKPRGALYRISKLTEEQRKRGVIAVSAGNHAQGVALASRINGISCKIVMPEFTTPTKINAVEDYGADLVLKGKDYAEARKHALQLAEDEQRTFIEGFDDPYVIAGQGTVGLEIMDELPDTDVLVVPVGGGGLISGIARAAKAIKPSVKVIGVQAENFSSVIESLKRGEITEHVTGDTVAEGIAIRRPGEITFKIIQEYVDEVVSVSEESIGLALYLLLGRNKVLVEPASASSLAAALEGKLDIAGKNVVMVLSGGNTNLLLLSKIMYKSMEHESKLVRFSFKIPDRPGTLSCISSTISSVGGNIYHADIDNLDEATPVGYQSIMFTVNLRGKQHAALLISKLKELGYKFEVFPRQD